MITAVNRPAVRTVRAAAPGAGTAAVRFGARRVVRVQASPDPPKSAVSENAGERVVKDISDSRAPTSAQDVGPALFEAQPHMASHYKAPNWLPAFTRRREIFAGRLAILGFAAACAFEVLTPDHLGPMGLTSALTGWSIPTVQLLYTAFVGHGLLALTWPGSPTFSDANIQDYMKRPEGPPTLSVNPFANPAKFLGCSPHFGFTKKNELFQGRLTMLGFLAAVMNETQTGLGPIGQVAFALGNINPSDELYRTVGLWIVAWGTLVTGIAYASGHAGTALGEEDIF